MHIATCSVCIVLLIISTVNTYDVVFQSLSLIDVINETVFVSNAEHIKSNGYPISCCESRAYVVTYDQLSPLSDGLIHMAFDDLDLSPDSSLTVFEVASDDSKRILFDYNSRKHVETKELASNIELCNNDGGIKTSNRNNSIMILVNSDSLPLINYAGFKVLLWINLANPIFGRSNLSTIETSHTVPCQVITEATCGQLVSQKIDQLTNRTVDYVWIVKPPSYVTFHNGVLMFIRILSTQIDGQLEVRSGIYSEADLLLFQKSTNSDDLLPRKNLSSSFGFYVRLKVDRNASNLSFQFVTGVHRLWMSNDLQKSEERSEEQWILCLNSSWLVLRQYECDMIQHCPFGEDEDERICNDPPASIDDPSDGLSFLKWLIPIIASFILCGLGIFLIKVYMRHKYHRRRPRGNVETMNRHPVPSVQLPLLRFPNRIPCTTQPRAPSGVYVPSDPNRPPTIGDAVARSGDSRDIPRRSSIIPIPMARSAPISIPIVVRPQIHREGAGPVYPPSYEEATADQSFGESSDSLEQLEELPEYHPPSYEDASQGKTDLVSSWVSSSRQPVIQ